MGRDRARALALMCMATVFPSAKDDARGEGEWQADIAAAGGVRANEVSPLLLRELRERAALCLEKEDPLDATLPPVAQKLYLISADPSTSVNQVISVAGRDPAIAGRIVRLANTSFYLRGAPVSSLSGAVLRVGVAAVRNLVLVPFLSARLVRDPSLSGLWTHCRLVAQICPFVSGLAQVAPETAQLAGLVHDAGELLLALEGRALASRHGSEAVEAAIAAFHEEVGAQLVARWRLPEEIVEAVRTHHQPNAGSPAGVYRLASVVSLADALALGADPERHERVLAARRALQIAPTPLRSLAKRIPQLTTEVAA